MTEAETQELFDLAEKLDRFQHPIESGLKVANMGTKTFRFENGTEKHEVQFNYSTDAGAQALLDCFERIAETEQDFIALDRAAHYDKLGVNDALLAAGCQPGAQTRGGGPAIPAPAGSNLEERKLSAHRKRAG